MNGAAIRLSAAKELRALLPPWAACVGVIAAGAVLDDGRVKALAMVTYGLGSVALGAHAVGHEYGHRTLGLLLSHPVDRRGPFFIKFAVLAVLLAALGLLGVTIVPAPSLGRPGEPFAISAALLIGLAGLFIAPWLTLLSRSAIAGLVFTAALAGLVKLVLPQQEPYFIVMGLISALAALAGWRALTRLEVVEGRGRDLQLPGWFARGPAPAARKRHPIAQLIAKELRLQQISFVVAGLSVVTMAGIALRRASGQDVSPEAVGVIAMIYLGALPIVVGALASAEERQLGTREWQVLLPIGTSTQWLVKTGVAIGLALLLGPALMTLLLTFVQLHRVDLWPEVAVASVLSTAGALYVSSLSTSGVRALLAMIPVGFGSIVAFQWVFIFLMRANPGWSWLPGGHPTVGDALFAGAAFIFSAALLSFAHANHRSSERPLTQVRRQAGWIATLAVAEIALLVTR